MMFGGAKGYSEPGSGSDLASLKLKLLKMVTITLSMEQKPGLLWLNMLIGYSV